MNSQPLMQIALGDDWHMLPPALQAHYQGAANVDIGVLSIAFPRWMRPYLWLLKRLGALIDRAGTARDARVHKYMAGGCQYWRREIRFDDGECVHFDSLWEYLGGNRLLEYVNPVLGLCMTVHVEDETLRYRGLYVVCRLGPLRLRIPEWLGLGHTTIVERGHDDGSFSMDFRLRHPWFGQVYRYTGRFTTISEDAGADVAQRHALPWQ